MEYATNEKRCVCGIGESNTYNYELYGCAIQQMVGDWRTTWFLNTPSMDAQFPFGEVQVCYRIAMLSVKNSVPDVGR